MPGLTLLIQGTSSHEGKCTLVPVLVRGHPDFGHLYRILRNEA